MGNPLRRALTPRCDRGPVHVLRDFTDLATGQARMRRSPKSQCESGRRALGSSRPTLRTPASAGHPSQSLTGRDRWGGYGGIWARCGGNGWGECGEAIGIFGWERNLGVENRRRHEDLRTVMANARFASPRGRCGPATGDVGTGAPATAHRFGLRSARSATRDIGGRTSA
jgi:hypothetical protein